MRTFDGGATRHSADGKLSYHRFLSPRVLRSYAQWMDSHRFQADGSLRDPDNWKRGMPKEVYFDSLVRHVMWAAEAIEQGRYDIYVPEDGKYVYVRDLLHAVMFNAMGWLLEDLIEREGSFAYPAVRPRRKE